MDQTKIGELVSAGISASSADNSQPWRFVVADDFIELGLDDQRLGMFFDPGLAASLMSCGGVCELMQIKASGLGYTSEIEVMPAENHPTRVARLHHRRADVEADPLLDGLSMRHTHRGHYRRWRTVGDDLLRNAEIETMSVSGHRVIWCRGESRRIVERLIYMADVIRFSHRRIHDEFHEKLRFGQSAEDLKDGLAADTLGISPLLLPVLRWTKPWSVASRLNRLGMNRVMALRGARVPCWSASGLGALIQSKGESYFTGGRALHRLWVAMNLAGLAFQPLGALSLFKIRMDDLGGEGFTGHQSDVLRNIDDRLPAAIPGFEPDHDRLLLLFRFGYPIRPAPRARRRPVEDFYGGVEMPGKFG